MCYISWSRLGGTRPWCKPNTVGIYGAVYTGKSLQTVLTLSAGYCIYTTPSLDGSKSHSARHWVLVWKYSRQMMCLQTADGPDSRCKCTSQSWAEDGPGHVNGPYVTFCKTGLKEQDRGTSQPLLAWSVFYIFSNRVEGTSHTLLHLHQKMLYVRPTPTKGAQSYWEDHKITDKHTTCRSFYKSCISVFSLCTVSVLSHSYCSKLSLTCKWLLNAFQVTKAYFDQNSVNFFRPILLEWRFCYHFTL